MPYRRKYKKLSRGRKRAYFKRKFSRKRQIKKNSNRVLSKFRVTQEVITVTNEAKGFISLSNLLYYHNAANVVNTEYSNFASLYDSVRPCGVKIKWIPEVNAAGDAETPLNVYQPMYTCADYNDTIFDSTAKSKAQILEYNNMKFKNAYRPQKWYFKLKKQPQNMVKYYDSGAVTPSDFTIVPQSKLGYFSVDSMQALNANALQRGLVWPNAGSFYYNIPTKGISDETSIGSFMITYYYAFIQRR